MDPKAYIASLISLVTSVWFTPLEEVIKIYVVTVVIVVTLLINLLFFWARLREIIINHLVAAVIEHVLRDRDVQKLIDWSQRYDELRQKIHQDMEKKKVRDGSHTL